jgi:hypothetical protein
MPLYAFDQSTLPSELTAVVRTSVFPDDPAIPVMYDTPPGLTVIAARPAAR